MSQAAATPVNTEAQEKGTKPPPTIAQDSPLAHHSRHHRRHRSHHKDSPKGKKPNPKNKQEEEEDQEDEMQEDDSTGRGVGMAEELSGDACHEMQIGDTCCALFCPCMTYGQILDSLDPNIIPAKEDKQMCHVSTGCLLWTGLMGLTIGGVQSVLSIPGLAGWMPTMYFGDFLDARELFLGCSYMLPQWFCHCPLRVSIAGKGKKGENACCSCMISSFCCCCSLSSLKSWGHENRAKYTEDNVCVGKCCPCCGVLTPSYGGGGSDYESVNRNERMMREDEYEDDPPPNTKTAFHLSNFNSGPWYHDRVQLTSSQAPLQHPSVILNSMTQNRAPQSNFYF